MPIKKIIFTGFSPNLSKKDVLTALKFLFLPNYWLKLINGDKSDLVEKKLKEYFNISHAYTFDSGRSVLYYSLKSLEIENDDEVLVQAYTCIVVSNAINHTGAKPVYVDVNDDFNMNVEDLKKKVTKKSKVLIIQHTFGDSAQIEELIQVAKENNLKVIEDCAHAFGLKYKGQLVGTFADIGMLSFGSDKILSCVRGGALITNNNDIALKINGFQKELSNPLVIKTLQHLLHYPLFYFGKKYYGYGLGKLILAIAKKINLMNKIIYQPEKIGDSVEFYPAKLANSLAVILLNQIENVDRVNNHRQKIAKLYNEEIKNEKIIKPEYNGNSLFLRYTILTDNPQALHVEAKKQGVILGNWYDSVIAPKDIDTKKTGYQKNSCVKAESLSKRSINLPTNKFITIRAVKKVIRIINSY